MEDEVENIELVVSLEDLKGHLRIMNNDLFDNSLLLYLKAAISQAEKFIGFSLNKENIKDDIRAAILLMAARIFNNPNDSVDKLSTISQSLLSPYRSWGIE